MIITRTPYRVSLFGGGSDYPEWIREHGGMVLTTTIDRYCYILLRRMPSFLGSRYRIFYSKMETVDRREDIQHPGVRGSLELLDMDEEIEINHAGDMPARSGLASSSAFTVGMLYALHTLNGDVVSRARLANEAIQVEKIILRENVGMQDQIECAYGGINVIKFNRDLTYTIQPIDIGDRAHWFADYLVLVFTGTPRFASEIASAQISTMQSETSRRHMTSMMALVPQAVQILRHGTPTELGQILHETWMLKRQLSSKITNTVIDQLYETARYNGAIGGKILGAGAGGFMLLCVAPEQREKMLQALGLLSMPVQFEFDGSQVVLR